MKKCTDTDHFSRWPFVAEAVRADGERNNGAVDLISNPEGLDLIHEATEENGLRKLLKHLNSKEGIFMTLGCASGPLDGVYHSYLELTFRDAPTARSELKTIELEQAWESWLCVRCKDHNGLAEALKANVVWECREFSLRGAAAQYLVTIYTRAGDEADHGRLLSWLTDFFSHIAGEAEIAANADRSNY